MLKKKLVFVGKKNQNWYQKDNTKMPESYWEIYIFDSGEMICQNKIMKIQLPGVFNYMWHHGL